MAFTKINGVSWKGFSVYNLYPKKVATIERTGDPTAGFGLFNVKLYGALGDDATDDTDAIRNAISAANSFVDNNPGNVATIYFPTGTYKASIKSGDSNWLTSTPGCFVLDHDDIKFLGDGPDNSIISFLAVDFTDPETNWYVNGSGNGSDRIRRGGGFHISGFLENIQFDSIRVTGNANATGDASNGGVNYACEIIVDDVIESTNHGLANGTILRFGNTAPTEVNDGTTPFYVINALTDTFQVSTSEGGEVQTLTDPGITFYATDGDGWDWHHKAIFSAGCDVNSPLRIQNCIFDRWRGEIIHQGGDSAVHVVITNSVFEYCNGSMISVPSLEMSNSIVRYGYNGIENFARTSTHFITIVNNTFTSTANADYAEFNAIAVLSLASAGATNISNNTITNWQVGTYLAESAEDTTIDNNEYNECASPIRMTNLSLYVDPESYDDVTVSNNEFIRSGPSGGQVIYVQVGTDITNKNFKIHDNTLTGNWNLLISDNHNASVANRTGYEIYNNELQSCVDGSTTLASQVKALWYSNDWGTRSIEDKADIFPIALNTSGEYEWEPEDDYIKLNNYVSANLPIQLDPTIVASMDVLPEGFTTTIKAGGSHSMDIQADASWNTLISDITLNPGDEATFVKTSDKLVYQI